MENLSEKNVEFNYFYIIFLEKVRANIINKQKNQISTQEEEFDLIDFYFSTNISKEEELAIYNQALYEICEIYIGVSKSKIDLLPASPWEFVDLALTSLVPESPYKESFLLSLQFIFQKYIALISNTEPTLMTSVGSEEYPHLKVTLNENYKITDLEAINIEIEQETLLIKKLLLMQMNHQIGPLPDTLIRIRRY